MDFGDALAAEVRCPGLSPVWTAAMIPYVVLDIYSYIRISLVFCPFVTHIHIQQMHFPPSFMSLMFKFSLPFVSFVSMPRQR